MTYQEGRCLGGSINIPSVTENEKSTLTIVANFSIASEDIRIGILRPNTILFRQICTNSFCKEDFAIPSNASTIELFGANIEYNYDLSTYGYTIHIVARAQATSQSISLQVGFKTVTITSNTVFVLKFRVIIDAFAEEDITLYWKQELPLVQTILKLNYWATNNSLFIIGTNHKDLLMVTRLNSFDGISIWSVNNSMNGYFHINAVELNKEKLIIGIDIYNSVTFLGNITLPSYSSALVSIDIRIGSFVSVSKLSTTFVKQLLFTTTEIFSLSFTGALYVHSIETLRVIKTVSFPITLPITSMNIYERLLVVSGHCNSVEKVGSQSSNDIIECKSTGGSFVALFTLPSLQLIYIAPVIDKSVAIKGVSLLTSKKTFFDSEVHEINSIKFVAQTEFSENQLLKNVDCKGGENAVICYKKLFCARCPENTFSVRRNLSPQLAVVMEFCDPCITGTVCPEGGCFACRPCASGTKYSVATRTCVSCTSDELCFSGFPTTNDTLKSIALQKFDPYFTPASWTKIANDETRKIVTIVTATIIGIVSIIIILVFLSVLLASIRLPYVKTVLDLLKKADKFANSNEDKQPTLVGFVLTILFVVVCIGVLVLAIVDTVINNVTSRTSIQPEQALNFTKSVVVGNFSIDVIMYGYMDNDCAPSSTNWLKMEPYGSQQVVHSKKTINDTQQCTLQYVCNNCTILAESKLSFMWSQKHAMASMISYNVNVPHFVPGSHYRISESILPSNPSLVLKGPTATTVTFSLIRTYLLPLPSDYFFYGIFKREDTDSLVKLGYAILPQPTVLGSTSTVDDLEMQASLSIVFNLEFDNLHSIVQEESKRKLFDFVSHVGALMGTVGTVMLVLVRITNNAAQKVFTYFSNKKKKDSAAFLKEELLDKNDAIL